MFSADESESDELDELVTPFIGTPSHEYTFAENRYHYRRVDPSNEITILRSNAKVIKGGEKVETMTVCKTVKKEEFKEEANLVKNEVTTKVERGSETKIGRNQKIEISLPADNKKASAASNEESYCGDNGRIGNPASSNDIPVSSLDGWVNWSFDAGRFSQAQQQPADVMTRHDAMEPANSQANWNHSTPPGLQMPQDVRGKPIKYAGYDPSSHQRSNKGWPVVPQVNLHKGAPGGKRFHGTKGKGLGSLSARSFSTQSNSSSRASNRNPNVTIKTCVKQNEGENDSVGVNRMNKRDRINYVQRLLDNPCANLPNPVQCVTESPEKADTRRQAWALWERLDAVDNSSEPDNPERDINVEAVKMARMGKEFLSMARTGDHYSAGKIINTWVRQLEQGGKCDFPTSQPHAYQAALTRYDCSKRSALQ